MVNTSRTCPWPGPVHAMSYPDAFMAEFLNPACAPSVFGGRGCITPCDTHKDPGGGAPCSPHGAAWNHRGRRKMDSAGFLSAFTAIVAVRVHRALGEPSSPSCPKPRAAGSWEQGPGLPGPAPRQMQLRVESCIFPDGLRRVFPGSLGGLSSFPLGTARGGPQGRKPQSWHHLPHPPTRGTAPAAAERGRTLQEGPWESQQASPREPESMSRTLTWRHCPGASYGFRGKPESLLSWQRSGSMWV